ncbi:MAG: hypothetical protein R6V84_16090 [Desulfobacterales bacterium]
MNSGHLLRFLALAAALAVVGLTSAEAADREPGGQPPAGRIIAIDLDACEPFEVRTMIMEVRRERGTLVVAEREIRELEAMVGGHPLKTEFLNLEGKPEPMAAFRVGQYVEVKGFLHPDGYVAALQVQKIAKPQEPKFVYRPVAESAKDARKKPRR